MSYNKALEELKKMSLEDQAKVEPKDGYLGGPAGILIFLIGIGYYVLAPNSRTFYNHETHSVEHVYAPVGETSIYDIISPFWGLVLFGVVGLFVYILISAIENKNNREYNKIISVAKRKLLMREKEKKATEEKRKYDSFVNSYNEKLNAFQDLYGTHTKIVDYGETYNIEQQIIVYGKANHIIIEGKDYAFEQIIGCKLLDNTTVKKGEITAVTSTNNGNMIKRAVVGDIIGGSAGAIIGGATAKQETTFTQKDDTISHSYTVIINIKDLVNPVITINLGSKGITAHEIEGLINAVININK